MLEAGAPGAGCSTRNGGQISTSIKPSQDKLAARHGVERAHAIRREGETALDWIEERIVTEGIACDFRRAGRFHAAHTPRHYEALARDSEALTRTVGIPAHVVARAELHRDDLPFPTRPLYSGRPWFLPPVVAWYRWRDRMQSQSVRVTA